MCSGMKIFPLGSKTLFDLGSSIVSGSFLYQDSNSIGYLRDSYKICIGTLRDHTGIIMGSKCS